MMIPERPPEKDLWPLLWITVIGMFAFALCGCASVRTSPLGDYGTVMVSDRVSWDPERAGRLADLADVLIDYAEGRSGHDFARDALDITIYIMDYASYERFVVGSYRSGKLRPPRGQTVDEAIAALQGDGQIVWGLSHRSSETEGWIRYFQAPSDRMFVHELIHVLYPMIPHGQAMSYVGQFLTSAEYKGWRRENHDE